MCLGAFAIYFLNPSPQFPAPSVQLHGNPFLYAPVELFPSCCCRFFFCRAGCRCRNVVAVVLGINDGEKSILICWGVSFDMLRCGISLVTFSLLYVTQIFYAVLNCPPQVCEYQVSYKFVSKVIPGWAFEAVLLAHLKLPAADGSHTVTLENRSFPSSLWKRKKNKRKKLESLVFAFYKVIFNRSRHKVELIRKPGTRKLR